MDLFKISSVSDLFETLIYFQVEPISATRFASTSNDNIVRMWELPDLMTIRQHGSKEYVYALMYDAQKDRLLVGNGAGEVEVLDFDYNLLQKYRLHQDLITIIRWVAGEHELLVTGSIDTTLIVSKAYSQDILARLEFSEPIWSFV